MQLEYDSTNNLTQPPSTQKTLQSSPTHQITLKKSPTDKRQYAYNTLPNGLTLITISDPEANFSACSIRVNVGSFSDPSEYPGLAHFLEHMLFLGSATYPDPNEYNSFFSKHGGFNNAGTASNYTSFQFDIANHSMLYEAIRRTASFFICPLFSQEYVEKELNAVDSEFKKEFVDDECRYDALLKHISAKGSFFNTFNTGNKETLGKEGTKEALMEFWKAQYSANKMTAVVYGRDELEVLTQKSTEIFLEVENRDLGEVDYSTKEPAFNPEQKMKLVKFRSIKDEDILKFVWFLPFSKNFQKLKSSLVYYEYLLENEKPGSIYHILRDLNLVIYVTSYSSDIANGFSTLTLEIQLSKIGLANVGTVVEVVGSFFTFLRQNPPQRWFYEELKMIEEKDFRFKNKQDEYQYVEVISDNADCRDKSWILRPTLFADYDENVVQAVLTDFLVFENMVVFQQGKDLELADSLLEPFYKVEYELRPFNQEFKNKFFSKNFLENIQFLKPNRFIARDLEILPSSDLFAEPKIFKFSSKPEKTNQLLSYYRCQEYETPKCSIHVNINYNMDLNRQNLANLLYAKIFFIHLNTRISDLRDEGSTASVNFSASVSDSRFSLAFSGFAGSMKKFVEAITSRFVKEATEQAITRKEFQVSFNEYKSELENEMKTEPSELAHAYCYELLYSFGSDLRTMLQVTTQELNFEGFLSWLASFASSYRFFFEFCFVGNLALDQCEEIASVIKNQFERLNGGLRLEVEEHEPQDIIKLSNEHTDVFYMEMLTESEKTSALVKLIQIPDSWGQDGLGMVYILDQILGDEFFNKLRTEEQLGYVCSTSVTNMRGSLFFVMTIQGGDHDPNFYSKRMDLFLQEQLKERLFTMDSSTFEKFKASTVKMHCHKPVSLARAAEYYYYKIHEKRRIRSVGAERELVKGIIEAVGQAEFVRFYRECICAGAERRALEVYMVNNQRIEQFRKGLEARRSRGCQGAGEGGVGKGVRVFEDLGSFKAGREWIGDAYAIQGLFERCGSQILSYDA